MQDIGKRADRFLTKDTDLGVIHLGTNNALGNENDAQLLDNCSEALDQIEHGTGRTPLLVCSVPPTHSAHGQRRVHMVNHLLEYYCSKSNKMPFVDTNLLAADIGRDGVHLTDAGKKKLATSLQKAIQGFLTVQSSSRM